MATISKTPFEKFPASWDFSAVLSQGETISLSGVTAKAFLGASDTTAQVIATSPAATVQGSVVTFWVQGGTVGDRHAISVKVSTSLGQQLEGTVYLEIVAGT